MDEYFDAKTRIFLNQDEKDYAVLNYDYERLRALERSIPCDVVFFNQEPKANDLSGDVNPNFEVVQKMAEILKLDIVKTEEVIQAFQGVEHRLEKVRHVEGIDYVNDSKSTTAESGRWALERIDQPVIMICGGRDKNIDFSVLSDLVKAKVKKMFVIGEAQSKIREAYQEFVDVEACEDLKTAVLKAKENSIPGDCVVLSPMCASFDMFDNFEHRGKVYKEIVNNLV